MLKVIKLSPINATSNPQKMLIESEGAVVTITNILIGEVWLCSGQSNMEFPIKSLKDGKNQIANANDPKIRFLAVNKFNFKPYECNDCSAKWLDWSTENASERTSVGYFFARELRKKLDVPIGLIEVYFGGTSIACWTPASVYNKWPSARPQLAELSRYQSSKKYKLLKKREKLA